jgi:two-component system OmpR family response regulator
MLINMVQRPRMILSREQLLELTQGRDATIFDRSVDNQISRLRKKIEPDLRNPIYIKTVWGGGYVFAADVRQL